MTADFSNTFSLKWENHHKNILMCVAGLSKNTAYSDVTLCCEGNLFPVHRFILSSCSDYFALLFEQLSDKPNLVIVLKDVKLMELKSLLSYIYLGEVNITQDRLPLLVKAAEILKIKGLAVPENRFETKQAESTETESYEEDSEGDSRGLGQKRKYENNKSSNNEKKKKLNGQSKANIDDSNFVKSEPKDYFSIKDELHPSSPLNSFFTLPSECSKTDANPNLLSSCKYSLRNNSERKNCSTSYATSQQNCSSMPLITQLLEESPPSIDHFFSDITKEDTSDQQQTEESSIPWLNSASETPRNLESSHFLSASSSDGLHTNRHNPTSNICGATHLKKLFSCPYDNCRVSYKEKRALQDHINLHTGIRPYFCSYCDFNTTHRTTLIQHKKHKHTEAGRLCFGTEPYGSATLNN